VAILPVNRSPHLNSTQFTRTILLSGDDQPLPIAPRGRPPCIQLDQIEYQMLAHTHARVRGIAPEYAREDPRTAVLSMHRHETKLCVAGPSMEGRGSRVGFVCTTKGTPTIFPALKNLKNRFHCAIVMDNYSCQLAAI
jgi:hypothetical protein